MSSLNESTVEDAALDYLESLGWSIAHGPDIAPDTPGAERADFWRGGCAMRLLGSILISLWVRWMMLFAS